MDKFQVRVQQGLIILAFVAAAGLGFIVLNSMVKAAFGAEATIEQPSGQHDSPILFPRPAQYEATRDTFLKTEEGKLVPIPAGTILWVAGLAKRGAYVVSRNGKAPGFVNMDDLRVYHAEPELRPAPAPKASRSNGSPQGSYGLPLPRVSASNMGTRVSAGPLWLYLHRDGSVHWSFDP